MSYDLFLKPKTGAISRSDFEGYFKERKNYKVENDQAWYENNETGVYFVFEFNDEESTEESEDYYPISFNMNYFRPSFFALEAEPEVSKFINHFGMVIDDPQIDGMRNGVYAPSDFVAGWNKGNEFGYQSILGQAGEVKTLPTSTLENTWKWNYGRESLQSSITEDVFIPRIMFVIYKGKTVTACVWPDAIPSVIPEVDILLIQRKELAVRKLFTKKEDMAIGSWLQLSPLISKFSSKSVGGGSYLFYQKVPTEIEKAIKALPSASTSELEGISQDRVLNEELVRKYVA